MKKAYEKPIIECEEFLANEYVAACDPKMYILSCEGCSEKVEFTESFAQYVPSFSDGPSDDSNVICSFWNTQSYDATHGSFYNYLIEINENMVIYQNGSEVSVDQYNSGDTYHYMSGSLKPNAS